MSRVLEITRKRLIPGRKSVILLCVTAGLLLLSAVSFGLFAWAKSAAASQQAARVWANGKDERFAQISAFLADDHALTVENVYKIRDSVSAQLKENSITPPNESARLFIDAYSGTAKLTVSSDSGNAEAVATGVGGDFFFFHGFEVLSGQLISGDDLLKDVVVIDDTLAWRLYGATNVVGFEITVGNRLCYVGGVVSRGDKWPENLTYGEHSRIFVSFEMFESVAPGNGVTCYELVLPDPVSGFGLGIAKTALSADEQGAELVENSSRYGVSKLLGGIFQPGKAAMRTKAIALPYWENAARVSTGYAALFLAIALALLIFPAVCAIILLVRLWRRKGLLIKWINDRYRKRQLIKWENKLRDNEQTE